jgi:competence protein ComEA
VVLLVDVSGAVVSPDVVRVPEGARARDAIQAAGGFTANAERSAVNLAAPLTDGSQLYVPLHGEAPPPLAAAPAARGPAVAGPSSTLNLNTATAADLEALPGIGPALAERIVAYRGEHGPFRDAKSLTDVPGIGEKLLARFVDRLTVR